MATKWSKNVTREISDPRGQVNVTITESGVKIQKKGTQRVVTLNLDELLSSGTCDISVDKRDKWFWK